MPQIRDENGHGQWCTSCVGGVRAINNIYSKRVGKEVSCQGMAPKTNLLAVKCLGYYIGTGSTSGIISALEYASNPKEGNSHVMNLSLGGPMLEQKPEESPYYEVFKDIEEQGIIACVAAGNSGPDELTLGSPGCLPNVLTVGAYDPITGEVANFSSRGPTNWGDIKPDCIAPGVNILSGTTGMMDLSGDLLRNGYGWASGTSMACPHVAGLMACMKQAYYEATGKVLRLSEVKQMLMQLGTPKTNGYGYGPITWQMFEEWMNTQYGFDL